MSQLALVCAEVVDYWNDLALYFGTHRPGVTSELRPITPLESQVFEDALIRTRFAVLRLVLDLSEYGFICGCSDTHLGARVAVCSYVLIWIKLRLWGAYRAKVPGVKFGV